MRPRIIHRPGSRSGARGAAVSAALLALGAWADTTYHADAADGMDAAPSAVQECTKVSVNNASKAELQSTFESVGIRNAEKWAHEVDEYRPYPEQWEPKLRHELSKYKPSPETLDQIVACLSYP